MTQNQELGKMKYVMVLDHLKRVKLKIHKLHKYSIILHLIENDINIKYEYLCIIKYYEY